MRDWNVLVVDDEKDVHVATQLALKYSRWRGRQFHLVSAYSGEEADRVLASLGVDIDVALVDVVMESNSAGLELCRRIRANLPRTLRIVLRTGQAGAAPEEKVLNDYDIDYYLSKSDVTQQKLYTTIRACLRSSQDIATIIAVEKQLHGFIEVLKRAGTLRELMPVMADGLKFLEAKHGVRTILINDVSSDGQDGYRNALLGDVKGEYYQRARQAIARAHTENRDLSQLHSKDLGLGDKQFVLLTTVIQDPQALQKKSFIQRVGKWFSGAIPTEWAPIRGGLFVEFTRDLDARTAEDFRYDSTLFIKNWNLAYTTLQLQENVARERALSAEAFWRIEPSK
jgi:CheY-like chemotaxis protein